MGAEWKWLDGIGGALFVDERQAAAVWRGREGWRVEVMFEVSSGREVKGLRDEQTARDIALAAYDLPVSRRYRVGLPHGVKFDGAGETLWWWVIHHGSGLEMTLAAADR
jgi:hypothetical protein